MSASARVPRRGWLHRPRPHPMARARLVCFAYAGAGASMYHPWAALVPESLEVCAVQPPGREWRAGEEPPAALAAWIDAVATELLAESPLPVALFGHSLGALVAHEVACAVADAGRPPRLLVVSGRYPPWLASGEPPLASLDDEAFVREARVRFGALPDVVLAHPELLDHVLPLLRHDIALLEAHPFAAARPRARLACPILAVGGSEDPLSAPDAMREWRHATTGAFAAHELPGTHFFVHAHRDTLLALLAPSLRALGEGPRGGP